MSRRQSADIDSAAPPLSSLRRVGALGCVAVLPALHDDVAMSMEETPGYFGMTSRGVIAVHQDWPTYPEEHGESTALRAFGMFPIGTRFEMLDDVDQAVLFIAYPPESQTGTRVNKDPWKAVGRHVAVWHEDLLELQDSGRIVGMSFCTEEMWRYNRHQIMLNEIRREQGLDAATPIEIGHRLPDGTFIPAESPPLPDDDDDDLALWAHMPDWARSSPVEVTSAGYNTLQEDLRQALRIPPRLQPRILPLLSAELYDMAVRELALQLEVAMKRVLGLEGHVPGLVDKYARYVEQSGRLTVPWVRWQHVAIRTAMTYVRNPHAHEVVSLPAEQCFALISRLCQLIDAVYEVQEALGRKPALDEP